ncbi:hypothetical protein BLNAU_7408 [Blattamonas nauphoetae]|uniref:Uncharacterized protein n=1 Tax=Blattamonas nauphoetae TaxID=2049346 RepID=A0ABQ9Y1A3_9EUKA|nr:hypothetical protein BLNAU_7408 [Blattamonas nauphoetae]
MCVGERENEMFEDAKGAVGVWKRMNADTLDCGICLVKADLIPQLIISLNPQSLSFTEAIDIHTYLMAIINYSIGLATPENFARLEIEDEDEEQAVHETVFQQVLAPSEKYIWHLCVNRFSIIDGEQSMYYLALLALLLLISPYYQPTMEFVLHVPVILTTPSCLTFFENDSSIYWFLSRMNTIQQEWTDEGGEVRKKGKKVLQTLRMEGVEDAMEAKLQNNRIQFYGRSIVSDSIELNNQLGMNVPKLWKK